MGNDETIQALTLICNKLRIRHLDRWPTAGTCRVVLKRDAAIDHEPTPGVAVQIEIHANLTTTT
jgi:hypothetical protein